ncbi:transposase [Halomonas maura]|uniref:transposase n=1 Tax=Halomonas maura TaxID=117606 RepID=UPI00338DC5AB
MDESSFYLCSHHQKTFAPVGQTSDVKGKRGRSPRHMVIGAVSPEERAYFGWSTDTVMGATIVRFLKTLLRYWPANCGLSGTMRRFTGAERCATC